MSELGLRYYQEDAVRAVEKAIVKGQQEILLAMATVPVNPYGNRHDVPPDPVPAF